MKSRLIDFCEKQRIRLVWHSGRPGLPRNFDHLLDNTDAPYFFYMQEDWLANNHINLAHGVKLLQATPDVNILRYRWVGEQDVNHPDGDIDGLFRRIKTTARWYYAHNPYLANRAAIERLRPIGSTERTVNSKAKKMTLGVAIRIPSMFKHIGADSAIVPGKRWRIKR